jgi:hypothetical protein
VQVHLKLSAIAVQNLSFLFYCKKIILFFVSAAGKRRLVQRRAPRRISCFEAKDRNLVVPVDLKSIKIILKKINIFENKIDTE